MIKCNFSNQVCELLAKQLINEQAEVMKHEAVVNSIQRRIIDEKMKSIRKLVNSKLFLLDGQKYMVLTISGVETDNGGCAVLNLAKEPVSAAEGREFNAKETKLMEEYAEAFDMCRYTPSDNWEIELSRVAMALYKEHNIRMFDVLTSEFDFSEATEPEFYEKTGVYIDGFMGKKFEESLTLEDLEV